MYINETSIESDDLNLSKAKQKKKKTKQNKNNVHFIARFEKI
jgi:hypothetical protein